MGVGKYIVRALKCMVLVMIMFCIVITIVFYTSEHDAAMKPWNLFDQSSLTKILIFFLAYSFVYPLIGYGKRELALGGELETRRQEIANLLAEMNFVPVYKEAMEGEFNVLKFQNKSAFIRALRMGEDKVTFTQKDGLVEVEGQRKDIMRVVRKIEWYLQQRSENEE